MNEQHGEIIITPDIDVWPHELRTAQALASAGYRIEFLKRKLGKHERSADVSIDSIIWEMKSPKSNKLKRIERTLRDALHQSSHIIFDSQRIKSLNDGQIQSELEKWAPRLKSMRGLIFVTKKRGVIVIK